MQLGFEPPITPQIIHAHTRALRRARCGWCVRVLAEHHRIGFPRRSTLPEAHVEALEYACGFQKVVNSKPTANGVIAAWAQGRRLPSLKLKRVLLDQTAGAVNLDCYLGHPLARLAALEVPPLTWLQQQIAGAPRGLRQLAGLPTLDGPVVAPAAVARRQCQRVRDGGSLDALLLLLALTRHAELIEDFDAHRAPAKAAWDLLPRVIATTPWLQGNWRALVACLHRVIWARFYDSGVLVGPPLANLIENVLLKLKDDAASIELLAGSVEPESRQAVRELLQARFEIEQLGRTGPERELVNSLCARIDDLIDAVHELGMRETPVTTATG